MIFLLSKRLRYFVVTMEERCITRAAEILCITRSPLGKVITELENIIGEKLFIRKYNLLEPTPFALSLYEKVKPLYDSLGRIESDLNKKDKKMPHIIFDASCPYNLYKYFVNIIEGEGIEFTHQRLFVTLDVMMDLTHKKEAIIFSLRDLPTPDGIKKNKLSEDKMSLLTPEFTQLSDIINNEYVRNMPIFIKSCPFVEKIKLWLSLILKEQLPFAYFKECDADISMMLYSVSHGKAMFLLPEKMVEIYKIKGVKSNVIPGVLVKKSIYFNEKTKNKTLINRLLSVFNDYF